MVRRDDDLKYHSYTIKIFFDLTQRFTDMVKRNGVSYLLLRNG